MRARAPNRLLPHRRAGIRRPGRRASLRVDPSRPEVAIAVAPRRCDPHRARDVRARRGLRHRSLDVRAHEQSSTDSGWAGGSSVRHRKMARAVPLGTQRCAQSLAPDATGELRLACASVPQCTLSEGVKRSIRVRRSRRPRNRSTRRTAAPTVRGRTAGCRVRWPTLP